MVKIYFQFLTQVLLSNSPYIQYNTHTIPIPLFIGRKGEVNLYFSP